MILGLWMTLYSSLFWADVLISQSIGIVLNSSDYINYAIPLNIIFIFYAYFMLKGVSNYLISIFSNYHCYFNNSLLY